MRYEYTHFIPQNVAPYGAKKIGVYDANGNKIYDFPLGRLALPTDTKRYSFGLISDTHIQSTSISNLASKRFETAMAWFAEQGVAFVCSCGDITNHGFQNSDGTVDLLQFAEYKRIRELYPNLPIYAACGNHDNYFTPITNNLTELETYTGHGLYFSVPYENDLFIFVGQPENHTAMNDEEYQWLTSTLEANKGKRCFIFVHPFFSNDSGNTKNAYSGNMLDSRPALKTLLSQYKTILFHGHSHFRQSEQEKDKTTNYTNKNGFHSMHVPSLAAPAFVNASGSREQITTESYGYLVDVYDAYVVLNGIDFVNDELVPIGIIKIDIPKGNNDGWEWDDDFGGVGEDDEEGI